MPSNSELRQFLIRNAKKDMRLVFDKKGITTGHVSYHGCNADNASIEYYFIIHLPNGKDLNYSVILWEYIFKEELPNLDVRAHLDTQNLTFEDKIRLRAMWCALEAYRHFRKAYDISPVAWDNIGPLTKGTVQIRPDGGLDYKLKY